MTLVDDLLDTVQCPACNRAQLWEGALLGLARDRLLYRCRGCGWQWSEPLDADLDEVPRRNGRKP